MVITYEDHRQWKPGQSEPSDQAKNLFFIFIDVRQKLHEKTKHTYYFFPCSGYGPELEPMNRSCQFYKIFNHYKLQFPYSKLYDVDKLFLKKRPAIDVSGCWYWTTDSGILWGILQCLLSPSQTGHGGHSRFEYVRTVLYVAHNKIQ